MEKLYAVLTRIVTQLQTKIKDEYWCMYLHRGKHNQIMLEIDNRSCIQVGKSTILVFCNLNLNPSLHICMKECCPGDSRL